MAEYPDAVRIRAGHLGIATAFHILIGLHYLVTEQAGTHIDTLNFHCGRLVMGMDIIVCLAFIGVVGTRPRIVDGNEGDCAALIAEFTEIYAEFHYGGIQRLTQQTSRTGGGPSCRSFSVGGIAEHRTHFPHDLKGRTEQALALGLKVILHAPDTARCALVRITCLVEQARDLLLRQCGLESAVGKVHHDDRNHGGTDALH